MGAIERDRLTAGATIDAVTFPMSNVARARGLALSGQHTMNALRRLSLAVAVVLSLAAPPPAQAQRTPPAWNLPSLMTACDRSAPQKPASSRRNTSTSSTRRNNPPAGCSTSPPTGCRSRQSHRSPPPDHRRRPPDRRASGRAQPGNLPPGLRADRRFDRQRPRHPRRDVTELSRHFARP